MSQTVINDPAMNVTISAQAADQCWGEKALLSFQDQSVTIHLNDANYHSESSKLAALQIAGRKLDNQGLKNLALVGNGWDVDRCWALWQGFRAPKGLRHVEWPMLDAQQQTELTNRLQVIDWVRETINLPAEELSPVQLATNAAQWLQQIGGNAVSYHIVKGEALREQNYAGIYTVGRGSEREPALLVLDYNPSADAAAPVMACLVGKGITFDSGGYSLKQTAFMESMKSDMGGAATATGALALAIARGLKQRVKLYLCCADNLVSGNAFKLGDIIRYRNNKTVEVTNTDAEGRLVLADGLLDAAAQKPTLLVDCATLTGAAKIALGNDYHALFSFDDLLAHELLQSAEQENEGFWRLPLAEFHRKQLPSSFADLNNAASAAHSAGASTAAAFLSHFVENYQQGWLHIDCSATYRKGAVEQWAAGATGLGVRTLARLLLNKAQALSA